MVAGGKHWYLKLRLAKIWWLTGFKVRDALPKETAMCTEYGVLRTSRDTSQGGGVQFPNFICRSPHDDLILEVSSQGLRNKPRGPRAGNIYPELSPTTKIRTQHHYQYKMHRVLITSLSFDYLL